MIGWSTFTYELLMRPWAAFERAARSYSWGLGLIVLAAATLSWHVASAMSSALGSGIAVPALVLLLPFRLMLVMILWVGLAALIHLLARGFRGYGSAAALFLVVGLSSLPFVFLTPLAILTRPLSEAGSALYAIAFGILCLWSLVLLVKGVRRVYVLGSGAAVISVLASWALLCTLALAATALAFYLLVRIAWVLVDMAVSLQLLA